MVAPATPGASGLKVIVVNDHLYADGGADVVALVSAEELAATGVDVTLFVADARRADDMTPRRVRLVCTGQSDLLHSPNRARAALQGLWNAPAARAMRALLCEHDAQNTVVHLHSWTKSLSSSVVRAVLDAGFPLVCTLHDYFSVCPTGGLFDFQRGQICHRSPMALDCIGTNCDSRHYTHKLYRVARQAVQSRWGGLPSGLEEFIVVSQFSASILVPYLPAGAHVVRVRNPISVERRPAANVSTNESFVLVARLQSHKGQADFLRACELAQVQAVCVGEGPDLESLRQRFPQARFTGQLAPSAVEDEMVRARALVLPSLLYETQGMVVDEAAALGVPAIVSSTCAATDSVQHGETGMIFEGGNPEALAQVIARLRDEPATAARLGMAARERFWRDPPTPATHAHELLKVYADVRDRARSRAALVLEQETR